MTITKQKFDIDPLNSHLHNAEIKTVALAAEAKSSSIVYASLVLYVAALIIRLPVLDWGGATPDENPAAAAKVLTGQLSTDQQYYPPLLTYLTACAYAAYYAIGRVLGWWTSTTAFRAAYFESVTQFYVVDRLVVAALSSAAAPLTFLLAIQQRIRPPLALALSAITAILPASLIWSEIAKSDSALGPAFLLASLTAFRFYEEPFRFSRQIALASAIAISLSFKQSALFFLLPLLLVLFLVTWISSSAKGRLVRVWLSTAFAAVLIWMPLNVGILLDLRGFIDAQVVQSQMSLRNTALHETLAAWFSTITSDEGGLPSPFLLFWFCIPLFFRVLVQQPLTRFKLLTMWGSVFGATLILLYLAGSRQNSQLLLPYSVVITSTVLLMAGHFVQGCSFGLRIVGVATIVSMASLFAVKSFAVIREAIAQPVAHDVASAIEQVVPPGTRVMSDINLSPYLPVSSIGAAEMRSRNERLASKYAVALPPVAEERLHRTESGYIIRNYPFVIGGLENLASGEMKVILPFAWPLQPEEWQLNYWLRAGYQIFVFQESMLHHSITTYRDFFASIDRACDKLKKIPSKKSLFLEDTMMIYRCS